MRSLIVIAVFLGVAYAAPKKLATLHPPTGPVVKNEYIVIFNELVTDEQVESHHHKLSSIMAQCNDTQQRVMHLYHIGTFRGYSAYMNDMTLEAVREDTVVKGVHLNQMASIHQEENICDVKQEPAPWGIARVSQVDYKENTYSYPSASKMGEGVDVYILDTGIYDKHSDFANLDKPDESRAKWGNNFVGGASEDGNGHGTHVAGTVIGNKYGIAKKATAIAVKVLGDGGSGSWEGVIAGIDWVASERENSGKKSIINMSLGGGKTQAVNDAVEAAAQKGVHFAISAGNNAGDACFNSPASADVTAVAASDSDDKIAYFSNYGDCVEIIAPGVDIDSAWIGDEESSNTISGTSMSAPHVAGVMAMVLSDEATDLSQKELERRIVEVALEDKIVLEPGQTLKQNRLLHIQCKQD